MSHPLRAAAVPAVVAAPAAVANLQFPRPAGGRGPTPPLRVVSFGGGVQSTALLVLAAQGEIDYRTFLFCNVGEDSEHPATLRYVEQQAQPFAVAHGLDLLELRKYTRGTPDSVLGRLRRTQASIGIPVRMSGTGAPARRACTVDFKIRLVDRWLRDHGATAAQPARVALGFSVDEIERAGPLFDPGAPYRVKEYPLLRLHLRRSDCLGVIARAGLPQPPKSACWFCPYHQPSEWQRQQRETPDLFAAACNLEDYINDRRKRLGRTPVWFTRFLCPLREAFSGGIQLDLFDGGSCESGYCFR